MAVEPHFPVDSDGFAIVEFEPDVITLQGLTGDDQVIDEAALRRSFAFGGKIRAALPVDAAAFVGAEVELIGVPMIRGDAWCISSKGANLG